MDVAQQLGATVRALRQLEHLGKPARSIVAVRTYHTHREDLWDALTNAERLPRWFLPVSGELRRGGRYQLEGNASGVIEACDAPTHLAVTWEFGGQVSWVRVWLHDERSDRTRLELEHIELITTDGQPFWDRFGPGAGGVGWDLGLAGLAQHLASGAPNDPAAIEAWTRSPDGQSFIQQSSDAWCAAAIAAGTAEPVARAAAARTFAFYTGHEEPA